MVSAINSAIAGLTAAGKKLETSAQNIASSGSTDKSNQPKSDLATDAVNMDVASSQFKENLSTIKVADDMQKNLLDIIA